MFCFVLLGKKEISTLPQHTERGLSDGAHTHTYTHTAEVPSTQRSHAAATNETKDQLKSRSYGQFQRSKPPDVYQVHDFT